MSRMIPPLIHPTVRSAAERKLFEVIRDAPGTEVPAGDGGSRDGGWLSGGGCRASATRDRLQQA